MWQPASQVGMVILKPPPIPKIDHEVPLFPVEHLVGEEKEPLSMKLKSHEEPEPEETPSLGLAGRSGGAALVPAGAQNRSRNALDRIEA